MQWNFVNVWHSTISLGGGGALSAIIKALKYIKIKSILKKCDSEHHTYQLIIFFLKRISHCWKEDYILYNDIKWLLVHGEPGSNFQLERSTPSKSAYHQQHLLLHWTGSPFPLCRWCHLQPVREASEWFLPPCSSNFIINSLHLPKTGIVCLQNKSSSRKVILEVRIILLYELIVNVKVK